MYGGHHEIDMSPNQIIKCWTCTSIRTWRVFNPCHLFEKHCRQMTGGRIGRRTIDKLCRRRTLALFPLLNEFRERLNL